MVFFHSDNDQRWPTSWRPYLLDWSTLYRKDQYDNLRSLFNKGKFIPSSAKNICSFENTFNREQNKYISPFIKGQPGNYDFIMNGEPFYIRGVAYNPGHDWRDGNYPLSRRTLNGNFEKIKQMGANSIRRYGTGWYDKNILDVATENDLKVLMGFWLDPKTDYIKNTDQLTEYEIEIIKTVEKFKDRKSVLGWTLGNETWGLLKHYYGKPYLTLVRTSYLRFVERIAQRIHEIDPKHPVFIVHEHTKELPNALIQSSFEAPSVDFIGINSYYDRYISNLKEICLKFYPHRPYLVSEFSTDGYWEEFQTLRDENDQLVELANKAKAKIYLSNLTKYVEGNRGQNIGGFAYTWRDRMEGTVTWFGLTDYKGRLKLPYFTIRNIWTGKKIPYIFPSIKKIIGPHGYVQPGSEVFFEAKTDYRKGASSIYNWEIRRDDILDKAGKITTLKDGSKVKVKIPQKQGNYRIYVYLCDEEGNVDSASMPLIVRDISGADYGF